mmetsp:Transcript_36305/g.59309  ORF Transcript_36305/g.59309 Transcript_36305/m.59309 type:complete len:105 (+) Transcript_36305:1-315(+)
MVLLHSPVWTRRSICGRTFHDASRTAVSLTVIFKTPPASVLLKKYAKIDKGSGNPSREKVGSVTKADVEEIAKIKLPDLNTNDVAMAMRIVEGTARGMGITVEA